MMRLTIEDVWPLLDEQKKEEIAMAMRVHGTAWMKFSFNQHGEVKLEMLDPYELAVPIPQRGLTHMTPVNSVRMTASSTRRVTR